MNEEGKPAELNGSYRFKLDAKGRVSLPAKFRKVLSEDLVVTVALSGEYLMVFDGQDSFSDWVKSILESKFGTFDPTNREQLMWRSALKGNAFDVQADTAGRILLPADLREKAGVGKEAVIVGSSGYFEIWDACKRDEMVEKIDFSSLLS